MQLDQIIPWGRSLFEYQSMFKLTNLPLGCRILSCGDGPSSFNADATQQGYRVTSYDPIYAYDRETLQQRIYEVRDTVMSQIRQNKSDYVWDAISSPEELEDIRLAAMSAFLDDFDTGKAEGRYVAGSAPEIPFESDSFDLALSSHFLFLYSSQFGFKEHVETITELMRVAKEVRIYPLQAIHDNNTSEHLPGVMQALEKLGYTPQVEPVAYEFQKGAKDMLRILR